MKRALTVVAAVAALVVVAPPAWAQDGGCPVPSQPTCVGAEKLAERAAAECRRAMYAGQQDPDGCPGLPVGRRVSQKAISEYEDSWLHRTLSFQHDLADDVAFVDAPWIGTHNSFNDPNEPATVSHTDSNQQLGLGDQLRLDVRSLELDVHWVPSPYAGGYAPVVCHGQGQYAGCTTERPLADRLPEIVRWLDEHPRQVLLLYIQDEIYEDAGYAATVAVLEDQLGARIFEPPGNGCHKLPLTLTRDAVLEAGAQVVIVSSCGGLAPVAFEWPEDVRWEGRPIAFGAGNTCRNEGKDVPYASRLVRLYEDSTWLTLTASRAGQATADDGLTPETAARALACGVDLLGFDQLLPDDGRLAALPWSWASGEPAAAGACAALGDDGRWRASRCARTLPVACRSATGQWHVLRAKKPAGKRQRRGRGKARRAPLRAPCTAAGLVFAAPRTAAENVALAQIAGGRTVLLGLRRSGERFAALDRR